MCQRILVNLLAMPAAQIFVNFKTGFSDDVAKSEDLDLVRIVIHVRFLSLSLLFCVFCAFLWLYPFLIACGLMASSVKWPTIIYLFAAEKSFLHDTVQYFAFIRCDFVAMVEGVGGDGELLVRVPDDESASCQRLSILFVARRKLVGPDSHKAIASASSKENPRRRASVQTTGNRS